MKASRYIMLILAGLMAAGTLAVSSPAEASDKCLFASCGSKERLFGPSPGTRNLPARGDRSWNDIYNERNQERYQSGVKAQPFDLGSPVDTTRSLTGAKKGMFNDDQPQARSEHVRWCLKRYRSYAVTSNTYVTHGGRTRFCDSPFD